MGHEKNDILYKKNDVFTVKLKISETAERV